MNLLVSLDAATEMFSDNLPQQPDVHQLQHSLSLRQA